MLVPLHIIKQIKEDSDMYSEELADGQERESHEEKHDEEVEPFVCPECGRTVRCKVCRAKLEAEKQQKENK